jgi:hypothetical protein
MIRAVVVAVFAFCVSAGTANAQTCGSYPNSLTNGTTADAVQVMANFNFILNCLNTFNPPSSPLRGYIAGLTLSNDLGSPSTVVDVTAGVATSDDMTTSMTLAAFSKNCNAAWAVGAGNGGLDSGSALATSTWYHVFVIERTDTNVVDVLCSTSATSPTLPTSYTKKRRIGSIKTDASAHILGFIQIGDEFWWKSPILDVNNGSITTSRATLPLPSVPSGLQVKAFLNTFFFGSSGSGHSVYFSQLAVTDQAPINTAAPLHSSYDGTSSIGADMQVVIWTDTNQSIGVRADASSTTVRVSTLGWLDTRGRFN